MPYLKNLNIKNKKLALPIYLPDATRGVVKSLDSRDLYQAHTEAIVVNTYHLMLELGEEKLLKVGGIKKLMNFKGLVTSDSGGFQIMSLLHSGKAKGKIDNYGASIEWVRNNKKEIFLLSPERSIQIQFALGSDIIVCLDEFTNPRDSQLLAEQSVKRTIEWAKRSKHEFEKQVSILKLKENNKPILMAVIQGGVYPKLRERCAKELVKIGFEAYGYGGWPMGKDGKFDTQTFALNASLTPDDKLRFALGVGKPENLVQGTFLGYHIFDCVLPTRDARHYRLYTYKARPNKTNIQNNNFYEYIYINREKYSLDPDPISQYCQCYTCQNYSRAYLHHLFGINDTLAWRLATIHNLYFYNSLIAILRKSSKL